MGGQARIAVGDGRAAMARLTLPKPRATCQRYAREGVPRQAIAGNAADERDSWFTHRPHSLLKDRSIGVERHGS